MLRYTSVKLRNCRRVFTDSRTSGQYSSRLNCPYPVKMWWTVAGAVVGGTALVVAAPIALPVLGFGAGGVAAGSAAAAVHGVIGNVVAGSVFATLQSAGAAGLAGTTYAGLAAVGAAGGAAVGRVLG